MDGKDTPLMSETISDPCNLGLYLKPWFVGRTILGVHQERDGVAFVLDNGQVIGISGAITSISPVH